MRKLTILVCGVISAASLLSIANAEELANAKSKSLAALDLAKAARERAKVKPKSGCLDDYAAAAKLAKSLKKPLLVWVPGCEPKIREALSECIHVHQKMWNGNDTPRVVVPGPDGFWYAIERDQITPEAVRKVLRPTTTSMVSYQTVNC